MSDSIRRIAYSVYIVLLILTAVTTMASSKTLTPQSLHIFSEPESLTLYVPQTVSLTGFQFGVIEDGKLKLVSLADSFNALLLTSGLAYASDCYVYQVNGASPPLSQSCKGQIFRTTVAKVDVFWYDTVKNQSRDIAVFRDNQPTAVCSASTPDCMVEWQAITPTPIVTPIPLGFAGNPVTRNTDWKPVYQTFDGIEMALVPVGCFMMGSENGSYDEKSVNQQCFEQPFWIARYEVTNTQWAQAVKAGVVGLPEGNGLNWYNDPTKLNRPVVSVTWFMARDFAAWLGDRLSSEREWEFAARGPSNLVYPWGNDFVADNLVYSGNSNNQPADVGSRPTGNSWVGASDLSGNVWEWGNSIYQPYPYNAEDGREMNSDGTDIQRALRGGLFPYFQFSTRSSYRNYDYPVARGSDYGFRVVRPYQ